jgi:hypothetical protein
MRGDSHRRWMGDGLGLCAATESRIKALCRIPATNGNEARDIDLIIFETW